MTGILVGMAVMASGAIWLRGRGADARLHPALGLLALFALALTGLLALEGSRFEDFQALILPVLPALLAQHLRRLSGPWPWPRAELVLAGSGVLCLPWLLLPRPARLALEAGTLPDLAPALVLLALAGVALFWLALCLGTALGGGASGAPCFGKGRRWRRSWPSPHPGSAGSRLWAGGLRRSLPCKCWTLSPWAMSWSGRCRISSSWP